MKKLIKKTMEVESYLDNYGRPACAIDFALGKCCIFIRTRKFGTINICGFTGADLVGDNELDFLRPNENCPLWSNNNEID